jgi:glycosyltransferase involved in cell wall biosynthesis
MTHEIVVNGRFLSRRVTGVERHGREILRYIGDRSRLEMTRQNGLLGHVWEQFILPGKLNRESILWSPANTGPLWVRQQALTIHDLSALENPRWFQKSFATWYSLLIPILVRRARVLFAPSEYVRQKLIKQFGRLDVMVTPNGVDLSIFQPGARQEQFELPPCYILFLGTPEPRKNLKALLQVWNEIQEDFRGVWLVIAGTQSTVHRTEHLPADVDRVVYLGYVEESALPGLYANALFFVMPSLDEGFGLPALEAMACGTPVLVSNGGAFPEVVREAGMVYDLSDSTALSQSMRQCLQDQELRRTLKEKGLARARDFSWQSTAELVWNTLHEI